MADKKMTAAEKKAAAESKATERKRLFGAGAALAAVALFVGGYAVGNASNDDGRVVGSAVITDDYPIGREGPFADRHERHGDRPGRDGNRPGERFPGRDRGFGFEFPDGFKFPEDFDFPRDFEFPGPRGGFGFPEGFEFPEGFGFPGDGRFEFDFDFNFPEGFEFPVPQGPLSDRSPQPTDPPAIDDAFRGQGFLGVAVVETPDGVEVEEVFAGSPADGAGVEAGDPIISVEGVVISTVPDLVDVVAAAGAGTEVEVTVDRDGTELGIEVILGIRPN